MDNNEFIEVSGTVDRILYPQKGDYNDFKIVSFKPTGGDVDEIELTAWANFVVKGIMPDVFIDGKYTLKLTEEDDSKWGKQYFVQYISTPENFDTSDGRNAYLKGVLTEHQYDLVSKLDDPFKTIANKDIDKLVTLKGIGKGTANDIIKRFGDNYENAEVYVQLDGLGLTPSVANKLLEQYNSPELVREIILKEPYSILGKIDGVGFKTVDKIALDNGIYRLAPERVESCIEFLMQERANVGMSYLYPEQLIQESLGYLRRSDEEVTDELKRVVIASIEGLVESGTIVFYEKENDRVFMLKEIRDLEVNIAKEFIRLQNSDNRLNIDGWKDSVNELEKYQGWEFTDQQRQGIKTALDNQVVVVTGLGGCVDKDTEYFNGVVWKPISKYVAGEEVLQFNSKDELELVNPYRYIKTLGSKFIRLEGEGISQLVSYDHDIALEDSSGNIVKIRAINFVEDYEYYKSNYKMPILELNEYKSIEIDDIDISEVDSKDGFKYCFEVPSGFLVLRNNGKVFITGNSGKTSIVSGMLEVVKSQAIFRQCALSGRASARLSEATGFEGYTIHRLLDYNPEDKGFNYNANNQMDYDIIIVDEISMIGSKLFYDLISSIKSGSKLIMIGDIGQLESIGMGNVAKDLIDSGVINVINLTKIHRQAKRSAIISESINIRNGKDITQGRTGRFYCGELKDMEQIITHDNSNTVNNIIDVFKRELGKGKSITDIQVVVPMRRRGNLSSNNLNPILQNIYNPIKDNRSPTVKINNVEFRVGDKVLNSKNNYSVNYYNKDSYNSPEWELEELAIFNGDIGIIKDILDDGEIVIKFTNQSREVVFTGEDRASLELAYAITCHKLQGSESDTVIIGIDYSAYVMLSKEWLYTAITRASKFCVLCGQQSAIQFSAKESKVTNKQTILKDALRQLEHKNID